MDLTIGVSQAPSRAPPGTARRSVYPDFDATKGHEKGNSSRGLPALLGESEEISRFSGRTSATLIELPILRVPRSRCLHHRYERRAA